MPENVACFHEFMLSDARDWIASWDASSESETNFKTDCNQRHANDTLSSDLYTFRAADGASDNLEMHCSTAVPLNKYDNVSRSQLCGLPSDSIRGDGTASPVADLDFGTWFSEEALSEDVSNGTTGSINDDVSNMTQEELFSLLTTLSQDVPSSSQDEIPGSTTTAFGPLIPNTNHTDNAGFSAAPPISDGVQESYQFEPSPSSSATLSPPTDPQPQAGPSRAPQCFVPEYTADAAQYGTLPYRQVALPTSLYANRQLVHSMQQAQRRTNPYPPIQHYGNTSQYPMQTDLSPSNFVPVTSPLVSAPPTGQSPPLSGRLCPVLARKSSIECLWNKCRSRISGDKRSVSQHLKSKHDLRNYKQSKIRCQWGTCEREVSAKDEVLARHIGLHTKSMMYRCPIFGCSMTARHDSVTRHLRSKHADVITTYDAQSAGESPC